MKIQPHPLLKSLQLCIPYTIFSLEILPGTGRNIDRNNVNHSVKHSIWCLEVFYYYVYASPKMLYQLDMVLFFIKHLMIQIEYFSCYISHDIALLLNVF